MEFIIISGLSGAGKSKVASFLEDIGFYVVDNMPAPLMPKFAELCMAGPGRYDRVALVTDIRGGQTFDGLFDALHELHRMGCAYKILFVEASVETIIKRYKETRRMHPLSSTSRSLDEAVRQERTVLAPVRQRAEYIIDTSALSTAKLRGEVLRLFGDGGSTPAMSVSVISFGFKYGIPIEADLVFDVRFLPNPYYIAELRHQTGLDEAAEAIAALRALGVRRVIMLTGDQETAARAVCERLGIDTFRAQVLPADKASLIEGYKEGGSRLIMVGDGVNDSPALAAADVSVAMRDASDLAREVADITLLSSDLRELAALRRLSQRMLERINRNYRSILTINTSLLALGIFGILPPTTTALLHNASTMAISAASMRPYLPAPGGRGAQGKEPGNETA